MPIAIQEVKFPDIEEISKIFTAIKRHPAFFVTSENNGDVSMLHFSTSRSAGIEYTTAHPDLDAMMANLAGHMLNLGEMGTPLIEAAKLYFSKMGELNIARMIQHPGGQPIINITIKMTTFIVMLREHYDPHRSCNLDFICL